MSFIWLVDLELGALGMWSPILGQDFFIVMQLCMIPAELSVGIWAASLFNIHTCKQLVGLDAMNKCAEHKVLYHLATLAWFTSIGCSNVLENQFNNP